MNILSNSQLEYSRLLIKKLTQEELLSNKSQQNQFERLCLEWDFPSFIQLSESLPSLKNILIQQILVGDKSIGFIFYQYYHNKDSISVDWMKLDIIFDPFFFHHNLSLIFDWIDSQISHDNITKLCAFFSHQISDLGYIYFELPENQDTTAFFRETNENIRADNNWIFHIYPLDTRVNSKSLQFRNTLQFFWNNPHFSISIPSRLSNNYIQAMKIFKVVQNEPPYSGEFKDNTQINRIKQLNSKYRQLEKTIKMKIENYINARAILWQEFDQISQNSGIIDTYLETLRKNLSLLQKSGFRITIYDSKTAEAKKAIKKHQDALILNFIQSIPSQGTLYNQFSYDNDLKDHDLISETKMMEILGDYFGFLEFYTNNDDWVFAGLAIASYKKDPKKFSRQLYATLMFPEIFRGYSLGSLLSIVGMLLLWEKFDIFFDEATIFNIRTKNLVKRIGFESYGLLKNRIYSVNPNKFEQLCIGHLVRNFWIHPYLIKDWQSGMEKSDEAPGLAMKNDFPRKILQIQKEIRINPNFRVVL